MPIDDLLGADANQQSVTCKALDVFGELNGTSQEKMSKAIPPSGIDRLPRLLTWSAQTGCPGRMVQCLRRVRHQASDAGDNGDRCSI